MEKIKLFLIGLLFLTFGIVTTGFSQTATYTVTKTTDPNPKLYNFVDSLSAPEMIGTLQWAERKSIDDGVPSTIVFDIQGSAPYVIYLNYEPPAIINGDLTVDGTTQPGYQGTPVVIIDGQTKIERGLYFHDYSNYTVKGLGIRNCTRRGILFEYANNILAEYNVITQIRNNDPNYSATAIRIVGNPKVGHSDAVIRYNYLGTNAQLDTTLGCDDAGILVGPDANNNLIFGNTIAYNHQAGIYINTAQQNKISQNLIFGQNTAIALIENANGNKAAPDSLLYEENIHFISGMAEPYDTVEVYGSTGAENANEYIVSTTADAIGNWEVNILNNNYDYFVATATDISGNTSQISDISTTNKIFTKLTEEYCNNIWLSINQEIEAEEINNAYQYLFKFINTNTTDTEIVVSNDNIISLNELLNISNNTEYNVTVKALINGIETFYGEECMIKTKPYETDTNKYVSGQIFVKINDNDNTIYQFNVDSTDSYNQNTLSLLNFIDEYGIKKIYCPFILNDIHLERIYLVEFDSINYTNELINEFQNIEYIEYAEKVPMYHILFQPNDVLYSQQYNLNIIDAAAAWEINTGNDVVVAVTDNAIFADHIDLQKNIWVNQGEVSWNISVLDGADGTTPDGIISSSELISTYGTIQEALQMAPNGVANGTDDDGNGYIDDIIGWDVADNDNNPFPPATANETYFEHGTHVAGIVGAETNNSEGIASIGNNVKIMCVKASYNSDPLHLPVGYDAVQYAIANTANVINMSWGGTSPYTSSPPQTYQYLFDNAYTQNITCIAAAGNDGQDPVLATQEHYPAAFNHVIAVGATNQNDEKAIFSCYGNWIDVMAPGQDILSTVPGSLKYYELSGTSMASPLVAGLVSLMLSNEPNLTPDEIENCLESTCDNINAQNSSYIGLIGAGRINAFKSLTCNTTESYANFTADVTEICAGDMVSFTDASSGTPVSWEWQVTPNAGVVYSPSNTSQNPDIIFNNPGTYTVTLTVSDGTNQHSLTLNDYIIVHDPSLTTATLSYSNYYCLDQDNPSCSNNTIGNENCLTVCDGSEQTITIHFEGTPPFSAVITDGVNTYNVNTVYHQGVTLDEYNYLTSVNVVVNASNPDFWVQSVSDAFCTNTSSTSSIHYIVQNCCPNRIPDGDFEGITSIPANRTNLELSTYNGHNEYVINYYGSPHYNAMYIDGPDGTSSTQNPSHDPWLIWKSEDISVVNNQDYILGFDNTLSGSNANFNLPNDYINKRYAYEQLFLRFIITDGTNILLTKDIKYPHRFYNYRWMNNNFCWTSNFDGDITVEIYQIENFQPAFYDYSIDNISLRPVNAPPLEANIVGTNITCYGDNNGIADLTVTGGHAPYTYLWSNGATTEDIFNLSQGTYSVVVTDVNGCEATANITIEEPPLLIADAGLDQSICLGSNVIIGGNPTANGGTPPFSYNWTPSNNLSSSTIASPIANPVSTTNYTVVVTDANNCSASDDIVITVNPTPVISTTTTDESCYNACDGTANVAVTSGVAPYTYLWNTGETVDNISGLCSGTYDVVVTDANNCSVTEDIIINSPDEIILTFSTTDVCAGICNGTATVTASGGVGSYLYEWNSTPVQTTQTATGLCAGIYEVTVSDGNGCEATGNVTINSVVTPTITDIFPLSPCLYAGTPMQLSSDATNANIFYWQFGNGDVSYTENADYTFPTDGYYCITLTASNACGSSQYIETLYVLPDACACSTAEGGTVNYDIIDGYTITTNETWDNVNYPNGIKVQGDIFIEPNSILTINGVNVEFAPKGRIIVKETGNLRLLNNTILTNLGSCGNMWQGIEVWGDGNDPVMNDLNTQGAIYEAEATIENAHIAILLGKRNMDVLCDAGLDLFDADYSGGYAKIDNIDFINNGIGIKAIHKQNNYRNYTIVNKCNFSSTTLLDAKYNANNTIHYPTYSNPFVNASPNSRTTVGMWLDRCDNSNYYFYQNSFINIDTCIKAIDSRINVKENNFTNASYGFYAINTTSSLNSPHIIKGCRFNKIHDTQTNNGKAIFIALGENDVIYNNYIDNSYYTNNDQSIGIEMLFSHDYEITENEFKFYKNGINAIWDQTGKIGAGEPAWAGNSFYRCKTGITTVLDNSHLILKCNDHAPDPNSSQYNVNWDNFGIVINFPPWLFFDLTLGDQGVDGTNPKDPAGNRFQIYNKKEITSNTVYNYYHHFNNSPYNEFRPELASGSAPINRIYQPGAGVDYVNDQTACSEPPISIPLPPLSENEALYANIASMKSNIQDLKNQYENMMLNIDNGKTQILLNEIYGETPAWTLTHDLIVNSPLSDTVIYSLMAEDALYPWQFFWVIQRNLPVSNTLVEDFYTYIDNYPYFIKNLLVYIQNHSNNTTLANIKKQLGQAETQYYHQLDKVVDALLDSTDYRKEDAITMLENDGSLKSKQILFGTYLEDKRYTEAANKLNEMSQSNIPYINNYININQILLTLQQNNKTIYDMDNSDFIEVYNLATQCPPNPAVYQARAIVEVVTGEHIDYCNHGLSNKSVKIQVSKKIQASQKSKEFSLGDNYPDPATDFTTIPYFLPVGTKAQLYITDVLGRQVDVFTIDNSRFEIKINTKDYKPGVYYYSVLIENQMINTKEMVIKR